MTAKNTIIELENDRLRAQIWTFGARLNALSLDGGPSLCLGSDTIEQASTTNIFTGPIVGPVANRIANERTTLDGRDLVLEGGVKPHFLHSGPKGTAAQNWQVADVSDLAVTLSLHLPDGLGGLPGNRDILVTYALSGTEVHLTMRATTDAPTLMNLAHHPYWRLNGDKTMQMQIHADHYLPITEDTLPTGEIAQVAGTTFDYRQSRDAGTDLDHNFCREPSDTPTPLVHLSGDAVSLEVLSTAPGVQVYSQKPPALAVEPQLWPDAPNHPDFPSIRLAPGETFAQDTIYRFGT